MDDRRIGLLLRSLRRRLGKRQIDLAQEAGVSQSAVSRAERGHLDTLSIRTVRRLFAAVDARYEGDVRWRGGEADHLLDRAHAELGIIVAERLIALGWAVMPEVTFMRFGERGSIDLVATRADMRAATIIELKSEMTSFEEQQRRLDARHAWPRPSSRSALAGGHEQWLWSSSSPTTPPIAAASTASRR